MALSDYDPVAANNGTALGVNIGEGATAPSAVNNALRQICADIAGGINISLLGSFLSSTTLAQARTALGVTEGSASQTAFAALTNAANKVPYMTGSDAWATTDLTSFARTLLDDGDAATMRATLGAIGATLTGTASSGTLAITSGASTIFKLTWVDATASANATTPVSFHSSFSSWARAWVAGGDNDTAATQNNPTIIKSSTTTSGASVVNANPDSIPITVFAWGV